MKKTLSTRTIKREPRNFILNYSKVTYSCRVSLRIKQGANNSSKQNETL